MSVRVVQVAASFRGRVAIQLPSKSLASKPNATYRYSVVFGAVS